MFFFSTFYHANYSFPAHILNFVNIVFDMAFLLNIPHSIWSLCSSL